MRDTLDGLVALTTVVVMSGAYMHGGQSFILFDRFPRWWKAYVVHIHNQSLRSLDLPERGPAI